MNIEIANRLIKYRKDNHLSQEELADKLGLTRQAISKWECGESNPDMDSLIELSRIYHVSVDELISTSDNNDLNKKINSPTLKLIRITILVLSVALYIILGCVLDDDFTWIWGWTLILDGIVIDSIIKCIIAKKISYFAYPVLMTSLYCTFSFWDVANRSFEFWWFFFVTIPVFYAIDKIINSETKR